MTDGGVKVTRDMFVDICCSHVGLRSPAISVNGAADEAGQTYTPSLEIDKPFQHDDEKSSVLVLYVC